MSKVIALACGCSVELENVDRYEEYADIQVYVEFCDEHGDVRLVAGSDWIRFEPVEGALPDAEYGFVRE